jgi:hypothetical protein
MTAPMNSERREFYRDFFQRELASISQQRGSGPRLRWLAEHLEEYVDRWLGFCAVAPESTLSLVTAPGFGVIELGAEALGEELSDAPVPPDVNAAWQGFLSSLSKVRERGGRGEAEQLAIAARRVRSVLASRVS